MRDSASEKAPITGRKTVKEKNVGLRICICVSCCVIIMVLIIVGIKVFWYDDVQQEREKIDDREVFISHYCTDHSVDPSVTYNCSNSEPCSFKCKYVRENLLEEKRSCEYQDYFDVITTILEILLILGIIGCLCGQNN